MDKETYKIVYNAIEKYDPIGIAYLTENEYEPEAIDITNRCCVLSEEDLYQYTKDVFEFWFGKNLSANKDDIYRYIAREIKSKLDEGKEA